MPSETATGLRGLFQRGQSVIFPLLIVGSVLVIVAPLPPLVMDLMLACNVTIAVVILLTTIYVSRPLEFSVFPAILLGTTLARLVLNVASTRLILTRGAQEETAAAGGVIEAFGQFVAGGEIAVGLILFTILVAIQFLVITKGATRISEVAARFALDGMPGKQLAIDADLAAGLITKEQAREGRQEVTERADFYGAMDGASKFVRGDAIASIVITLINIAGGLYVGMVENSMALGRAVEVFTTLTIGDGLVTQVPAFLISLAAGLIVTRTSSDSNLPRDVVGQLFRHHQALFLAAGFLMSLAFTGLPTGPMIVLSIACGGLGWSVKKAAASRKKDEDDAKEVEAQKEQAKPDPTPEDNLLVDALELDLGVGLLKLADPSSGGDLLERVTGVRLLVAKELGIILPTVRIRDNVRVGQRGYQFKVRGVPVAWGSAYTDALLAINTGAATGELPGVAVTEPAFKRPGYWIEQSQKERAELQGFSVVEPTAMIITHLSEVVREHASELLTRHQVHQLLEHLRKESPTTVDELVPDVMKTHQIHQVLANLLRERVGIRDLETILETMGMYAERVREPELMTEYVRTRLARQICQQYRDSNRVLRVISIDPHLEDVLAAGMDFGEGGLTITLSPPMQEAVARQVADSLEPLVAAGYSPVVLCSTPQVRAGLKRITTKLLPKLAVLSMNEMTRDTTVESVGQVADGRPAAGV